MGGVEGVGVERGGGKGRREGGRGCLFLTENLLYRLTL